MTIELTNFNLATIALVNEAIKGYLDIRLVKLIKVVKQYALSNDFFKLKRLLALFNLDQIAA